MMADSSLGVNDQNRFGRTPLHYACRAGQLHAARALINEGHARVDVLTNTMSSTAHECCRFGHAGLLRLVLECDRELVHGVNTYGSLPIHVACIAGSTDCVKVLMEWSSSTSARNKKGMTPIHIACENADVPTASVLLESAPPAQLLIRDAYDSLPLHHACQNNMLGVVGRMMAFLEEAGHLLRALDLPDCTGMTPLQYAAKNLGIERMTLHELRAAVEREASLARQPSAFSLHHESSCLEVASPLTDVTYSVQEGFTMQDMESVCSTSTLVPGHPSGEDKQGRRPSSPPYGP